MKQQRWFSISFWTVFQKNKLLSKALTGNEVPWEWKECHLGTYQLWLMMMIYHPVQSQWIQNKSTFFFHINDRVKPICYIHSSIHIMCGIEWMYTMNVYVTWRLGNSSTLAETPDFSEDIKTFLNITEKAWLRKSRTQWNAEIPKIPFMFYFKLYGKAFHWNIP